MANEIRIEKPAISTDAKEQTAEVIVTGREPGKQKDIQIEVTSRVPGKEKVSVSLDTPENPKTN